MPLALEPSLSRSPCPHRRLRFTVHVYTKTRSAPHCTCRRPSCLRKGESQQRTKTRSRRLRLWSKGAFTKHCLLYFYYLHGHLRQNYSLKKNVDTYYHTAYHLPKTMDRRHHLPRRACTSPATHDQKPSQRIRRPDPGLCSCSLRDHMHTVS